MDGIDHLLAERNELRVILSGLPVTLDAEPCRWYRQIARRVIRLERGLPALPGEMRQYLAPIIGQAVALLHQEASYGETLEPEEITEELIGQRVHADMVTLSQEVSERFSAELEPIAEHIVSLDDLVAARSDVLRMKTVRNKGGIFQRIYIRHPITGKEHSFKLPLNRASYHKGGPARVLLKIYAGAPLETILSELPINDVDIYTVGEDEQSRHWAKLIGADEQGIETAKGETFDFSQYASGRDMTFNQACIGLDGLHFSDAAYEAARSGRIELVGHYIPDRAIYGFDRYPVTLDETPLVLAKPRGMMRFIKAVAENKALSFEHLPVNQNLDFGIYWLVLARKWSKSPKTFPERMQRMFHICQQMGQTRPDEHTVMDALHRVHSEYPYFNIEHQFTGEVGVARWIAGKLIKQLDREFGWSYAIPSGVEFVRHPGDIRPKLVNMEGFRFDEDEARQITRGWNGFIRTSRERLREYESLQISSVERYFIDADMQGLPDYLQDLM